VLQIWKAAGATSPDSLRTLFYKRSLGKFFTLVIQLALDAGASAGAFYTGVALGQSKAFGAYTLAVEYLAYCLVSGPGKGLGCGGVSRKACGPVLPSLRGLL